MSRIEIPLTGYGMSASEYGEMLWLAARKLEKGQKYIAHLENEQHSQDEIEAYAPEDLGVPEGIILVLTKLDQDGS